MKRRYIKPEISMEVLEGDMLASSGKVNVTFETSIDDVWVDDEEIEM